MDYLFAGEFIPAGYDAFAQGDGLFLVHNPLNFLKQSRTCGSVDRRVKGAAADYHPRGGSVYDGVGFYLSNILLYQFNISHIPSITDYTLFYHFFRDFSSENPEGEAAPGTAGFPSTGGSASIPPAGGHVPYPCGGSGEQSRCQTKRTDTAFP